MLAAQKAAAKDEPSASDIYEIGCVANILQMLKLPDGTVKVLVEGAQRARITEVTIRFALHGRSDAARFRAGRRFGNRSHAPRDRSAVRPVRQTQQENSAGDPASLSGIDDAGRLADTMAAHLPLKLEQKQVILEMFSVPSAWSTCWASSKANSTSCRWKSASVAASSARWRSRSASTT
jgi:ATP-dependent Lon protease